MTLDLGLKLFNRKYRIYESAGALYSTPRQDLPKTAGQMSFLSWGAIGEDIKSLEYSAVDDAYRLGDKVFHNVSKDSQYWFNVLNENMITEYNHNLEPMAEYRAWPHARWISQAANNSGWDEEMRAQAVRSLSWDEETRRANIRAMELRCRQ